MTIAILLYDQLLFRPMVAWADKFRVEQTAAAVSPRSWVLDLFRRSELGAVGRSAVRRRGLRVARYVRLSLPRRALHADPLRRRLRRVADVAWYALMLRRRSAIASDVCGRSRSPTARARRDVADGAGRWRAHALRVSSS